jgi:hypothetical protein
VNYTYSGAARPLSAIDPTGPINYVTAATYAPQGSLYRFAHGSSISGAITYNARLQPLQLYFTTGTISSGTLTQLQQTPCPTTTAAVMSRSYNFGLGTSDNGNVNSITNCRDTNRTQNFTYDAFNRIQTAYTSGPNWGEDFTIDAWGNLTIAGWTRIDRCVYICDGRRVHVVRSAVVDAAMADTSCAAGETTTSGAEYGSE